jgi:hypothetical protein
MAPLALLKLCYLCHGLMDLQSYLLVDMKLGDWFQSHQILTPELFFLFSLLIA